MSVREEVVASGRRAPDSGGEMREGGYEERKQNARLPSLLTATMIKFELTREEGSVFKMERREQTFSWSGTTTGWFRGESRDQCTPCGPVAGRMLPHGTCTHKCVGVSTADSVTVLTHREKNDSSPLHRLLTTILISQKKHYWDIE